LPEFEVFDEQYFIRQLVEEHTEVNDDVDADGIAAELGESTQPERAAFLFLS
jgi:hypothetical protein